MWVKLLKDLRYEGGRVLKAGTVHWIRRTGVIKKQDDGSYKQDCSTMTIEPRDEDAFILLLPDEAEHDLYEETHEPKKV